MTRPRVDRHGNLGYSRLIDVASPDRIRRKNPHLGSVLRDPNVHDGIEEHFVEKGSTILYFDRGAMVELDGAD